MMNYFSILAIILGFGFSEFINPETEWSFDQSTSQAFYMFEAIEIEGEIGVGDGCAAQECSTCDCCQDDNFNSCDVIGAFYTPYKCSDGSSCDIGDEQPCEDDSACIPQEDVCVGWVYLDSEGWTTVPVNGDDGGSYSENYPSPGDQVRFVLYDASQNLEIDLEAECNPSMNAGNVPADCSFSNNGIFLYTEYDYDLDNNEIEIPDEFELLNIYPNPFNPSVNIDFYIETYSKVNISVYDLLGNVVQTLIYNNMYVAGNHSIYWEPSNVSSGEYLIRLTINDSFIKTEKVTYLK